MGEKSTEESKPDLKIQSLTKLYILLLLSSNEPLTGYRILKRIKQDLNITASPTYTYNFLKELFEKKYITELSKGSSKRSKGFKVTISGKEFVSRIIDRFDNLIQVAIQPRLTICAHCGVKLYDNYHLETIHGEEMKFCCIHCANAYKNSLHKI